MILKYRTIHDKGTANERDQWNYIDGFSEVSVVYYPAEKCPRVILNRYDGNGPIAIDIRDEGYLLNEKGVTIERLFVYPDCSATKARKAIKPS